MSEDRRIGSFAKVRRGASPRPIGDPNYFGGNVGWVRIIDVTQHNYKYLKTTEQYLSKLGQSKSVAVDEGDLIMSICATVGKPIIVDMPACIHDGFVQIYDLIDVDTEYLFYQLQFHEKDFEKRGQPGTQVNLNTKIVEDEEVWLPKDIYIQKKIAKILSNVDRAIAHTEALIEKYQQIKAGLMHDLFTRGIGADGKLRPPRDEAPELYQESAIGWIPIDWDCSQLKAKSRPGIPHLRTGPFGSSLKGDHWVEDGTPVITIGTLGEGEFNTNELLFVNEIDTKRLREFQMKVGDVVFSRVADVGRSVVISEDQAGWIMSSNLMRISLDKSLVKPEYLQYQLSYDFRIKRQVRQKVNSGGRDVANSEILNSLFFSWPTTDEQIEIVKRATAIDSKINANKNKLNKLSKLKTGLMHDLLTGKVPVKVHSDEVDHISN